MSALDYSYPFSLNYEDALYQVADLIKNKDYNLDLGVVPSHLVGFYHDAAIELLKEVKRSSAEQAEYDRVYLCRIGLQINAGEIK